jgi:hypothetical protein
MTFQEYGFNLSELVKLIYKPSYSNTIPNSIEVYPFDELNPYLGNLNLRSGDSPICDPQDV